MPTDGHFGMESIPDPFGHSQRITLSSPSIYLGFSAETDSLHDSKKSNGDLLLSDMAFQSNHMRVTKDPLAQINLYYRKKRLQETQYFILYEKPYQKDITVDLTWGGL